MQFADVQLYHRKLHNAKQDKLTQTLQAAALFLAQKRKKKYKTYFPWMADCINKQQNCNTNAYLRVLLRNLCNSCYINKTLDVSVLSYNEEYQQIFQSVLSCAEQQWMRWSPAAVANAFPADGNNRRHRIIWMLELIPAAAHFTTGHKLHKYPE